MENQSEAYPSAGSREILTVHGTGDSLPGLVARKWWEKDSEFARKLTDVVEDETLRIRPFVWSGANSQTAREKAASELSTALESHDGDLQMIAHSHGGHICLRALSLLSNDKIRNTTLILVGSPFLVQAFSSRMWLNVFISTLSIIFVVLFSWSLFLLDVYDLKVYLLIHFASIILSSFLLSYFSIRANITNTFLIISMTVLIVSLSNFSVLSSVQATAEYKLSAGIFSLSCITFIHLGQVFERMSYDAAIRRVLLDRRIKVYDISHPKDEVLELFENRNRIDVDILTSRFCSKVFRSLLIYAHFAAYTVIGLAVLVDIFGSTNFSDFSQKDIVHLSDVSINFVASFIVTYAAVEIFARYFSEKNASLLTNLANTFLRGTLASSMLGSDSFSATDYDPTRRFQARSNIPIPETVADEMSEGARAEAEETVLKLLDYNVLRPAGVFGTFEELEGAFSWKSLLHCRYFDTDFVVDTICAKISGPLKITQGDLTDTL